MAARGVAMENLQQAYLHGHDRIEEPVAPRGLAAGVTGGLDRCGLPLGSPCGLEALERLGHAGDHPGVSSGWGRRHPAIRASRGCRTRGCTIFSHAGYSCRIILIQRRIHSPPRSPASWQCRDGSGPLRPQAGVHPGRRHHPPKPWAGPQAPLRLLSTYGSPWTYEPDSTALWPSLKSRLGSEPIAG
jgi:hypothetical protein